MKPRVKRLYIRDYDSTGIQRYIPYGIACLSCQALIVETFQHNPTKTKLRKYKVKTAEEYNEKRAKIFEAFKSAGI